MRSPEERVSENRMHEFYANPSEYIPAEDCETGIIYWSDSSQIGQVALCAGINQDGSTVAIGIAEQQGQLRLQYEYHRDTLTGSHIGYWRPHVALPWATEGTPEDVIESGIEAYFATGSGSACRKLFNLLLDTEIEVTQDKIDWLTSSTPLDLRNTYAYQELLEINQINLAELAYKRDMQTANTNLTDVILAHAKSVTIRS